MEIKIRNEEARDIDQVRSILCAAFPTEAKSKLVDALRANAKAIISLVATSNDQVIGHMLCIPVSTTPSSEPKRIGVAPVAVHPDFQIWEIGSRLGFERASTFGIRNEYGVDDEFMFIRFNEEISPNGLVKYAEEFPLFTV